jgi:hypothetical protein
MHGAGRVLIVERLIPDDGADRLPALLGDMNMLVFTGGQERTNAEYGAPWVSFGRAGSVSLAVVSRRRLTQTRAIRCSTRPGCDSHGSSQSHSRSFRQIGRFLGRPYAVWCAALEHSRRFPYSD